MTVTAAAIMVLISLRGCWQGIGAIRVARWTRARAADVVRREGRHAPDDPELLVLVPVLREQLSLPRFVEAVARCAEAVHRVTVIVVTTQREIADRERALRDVPGIVRLLRDRPSHGLLRLRTVLPAKERRALARRLGSLPGPEAEEALRSAIESAPTTLDVARSLRERYRDHPGLTVRISNATADRGGKPTQLACALRELDPPAGALLAVYDVDTVPHTATFVAAVAAWRDARARGSRLTVLQQQRLPLLRPATGFASFAQRVEMLSQLRRSVAVEMRRLVGQLDLPQQPRWVQALQRPMIQCVGTGLFTTTSQVDRVGGFVEPMEDLAVGFRTSLLGDGFAVLPVLCVDEAYADYHDVVNLHSRAFVVCATEPTASLRATAGATTLGLVSRALLVGREHFENVVWLFGPAAFVWAAAVLRSGAGIALSLAALLLFCYAPTIATLVAVGLMAPAIPDHERCIRFRSDPWRTVLAVTCCPAFALLRLPGAWRGIWLLFTADRGSSRFGKTER